MHLVALIFFSGQRVTLQKRCEREKRAQARTPEIKVGEEAVSVEDVQLCRVGSECVPVLP